MTVKTLGELVRQRRQQLGLTQDQVAALIPMSKPYLCNFENGKVKNPPKDHILKSLERALGFEADQLVHLANVVRTPMDVRQRQEILEVRAESFRVAVRELLRVVPPENLAEIDLDRLELETREESSIEQLPVGVAVPVVNEAAAGYPLHFTGLDYPISAAKEYVRCPGLYDRQAFAVRVVGDLMEPRYRQGDVVVFSPAVSVQSGDDCFIRFEGDGRTTFKRVYQDDQETARVQPLNDKYPAEVYRREQITGLWPAVFRIERLRRG